MSSTPRSVPDRLSHYRLIEQIGAGGMGVVYLAHDEQLQRDVGIKVLPAGSLADEAARKRFRKEALSLAKLNHPNIATVHEFGSDSDTDFLVTEYIAGATLSSKLRDGGALPCDQVFHLGIQLGQGLAAAHDQGVVHRDLKPANLRLTPDGRLKILDFGLAQLMPHASDLSADVSLTQSQEISGTLPYMAPEQLKGEKADPRNDVWAAGAVLYEMATGKRPFPQTNPSVLINAILNEAPPPPSTVNPNVPAELDRIILRALAKNPSLRYQKARDLTADLERQTATAAAGPRRLWLWLAIGAASALAIAFGAYVMKHPNKPAGSAIAVMPHRRAVAVLGFKNLSDNPEKAWLSTALSEMLTTELGQGDQLRTISGESVAQMKQSLSLPDADSFSKKTLHRIGQNLGSDDVVVGSFLPEQGGQLRLDLRLQDTATGETLATVSEKGSESQIDDLVSRAGAELRGKLGVAPLSDAQTALVRASLPTNPEAARLYSQGLRDLRVFDAQSARNLLQQAAALEPNYAPTHSALAQALSLLGFDDKAKEQARQALDLSAQASREERLLIEGRSHEILGQYPDAVENYRALWEFFPDRVDYGLALVHAQILSGSTSDSEATLAQLRKLPVSDADAARIDIMDSNIGSNVGDVKRQEAMAQHAADEGRAIDANLLVAEALIMQADALEKMGQTDNTISLIDRAKELYIASGDRRGIARTQLLEGDLLFDQGHYADSQKRFEEALGIFRQIGAEKSIRNSMERIGNVAYAEGKPAESETYYDQALRFDLSVHDRMGLASDYGNIANAMDDLGDLAGAQKMQLQALDAFNGLGDKKGATETIYNLGNLSMETGDLAAAKKHFDDSLRISREIAYRVGEPYPISGLGDFLSAQGDFAGAQSQYEQALAMCKEMNNDGLAARIHFSQAYMQLEEGHFADAEKLAREMVTAFDKNNPAAVASSQALLARSLLAQGKVKEAQSAAAHAVAIARQSVAPPPNLESALAEGLVQMKLGKYAEARQSLEPALVSARKHGYRLEEYEIRLALCELEKKSGSASARADLASLESDALAQGALHEAEKAKALAESK